MTDLPDIGTIALGDLRVHRIGLGTNRITDTPAAHQFLRQAVELGVDFIDTAHRYAGGQSETAIGHALSPYKAGLVVATKGGMGDGAAPATLRRELEESLRRLATDHVDLYQLHRVDPGVPIEESVAAIRQFQEEGKVRHIGLSEVTIGQLEAARAVAPIVSVQNEYNVLVRKHEDLVDYCSREGIVFIPWFPLGGLHGDAARVEARLAQLAQKYDASPQQLAIAWLLARSPQILPIPGTLTLAHLQDNLKAAGITLTDADYEDLTDLA